MQRNTGIFTFSLVAITLCICLAAVFDFQYGHRFNSSESSTYPQIQLTNDAQSTVLRNSSLEYTMYAGGVFEFLYPSEWQLKWESEDQNVVEFTIRNCDFCETTQRHGKISIHKLPEVAGDIRELEVFVDRSYASHSVCTKVDVSTAETETEQLNTGLTLWRKRYSCMSEPDYKIPESVFILDNEGKVAVLSIYSGNYEAAKPYIFPLADSFMFKQQVSTD